MNAEYLRKTKKKISKMSYDEEKERNLYLKKLSNGTLQGPHVEYPSIDKVWLKYYSDEGIATDIPQETAYKFVYNSNKEHLNEIALEYLGNKISYKKFFEEVEKTSKAFLTIGVRPGVMVTMGMATTPEMTYIFYALNRIGAVVNAIDPRLSETEIKEKMKKSNSKFFVGLKMCAEKVKNFKDELKIEKIIDVSPFESASILVKVLMFFKDKKCNWKNFINNGKDYSEKIDDEYLPNKPIIVLYTGGTTGPSKGVVLTNKNLNTMALTQVISNFNIQRGDSFLNFLPPFSAYSIVNAIHDPLYMGFKTILVPQFKPSDFPKLMKKFKPNHVLSGPILWDILMKDKEYNSLDLSFLKSPISGGDSMNVEFERKLNLFFEKNGCKFKVQQGYGMTEVSAAASYSSENTYSLGSVGVPYIKNIVSAFNSENDEELPYNCEGEIRISTPTMMKGYQNDDDATKSMTYTDIDGKRWIKTGDIGKIDKTGNIFIIGRMKRLIVRSGNKIFPINIENIAMRMQEVDNICVVEMEDKNERHVPIAYIVLNEMGRGKEEEVIATIEGKIKELLPDFYLPVRYICRNELPLTTMTKVDFKILEKESLNYIDSDKKIHLENH